MSKVKDKPLPSAETALAAVQAGPVKPEARRVPAAKIGDMIHQGDVYLVRVTAPKAAPGWKVQASRQLAPGNSAGARHVIDPDADVVIYDSRHAVRPAGLAEHALLGPLVHARGPFALIHPEHGDHEAICAGWWQTLFQVDAVTMRRVQD